MAEPATGPVDAAPARAGHGRPAWLARRPVRSRRGASRVLPLGYLVGPHR